MKTMMMASSVLLIATFASSAAFAGQPKEEHFDVWLRVGQSGNLVTGAISEDGDPISGGHRVFGAEFGEEPGEPFFSAEPGFQAFDGAFAGSNTFQLNLTDSLMRWNGVSFEATPETMTVEFGPSSVTTGNGFVDGFTFAADPEGGFHDHFDLFINGDGGDPTDGVYLLPMSIADVDGNLGSTETFWFVMNLNMDEDMHDAAMDWVTDNLAPAPGALALLAMTGVVGTRRRR